MTLISSTGAALTAAAVPVGAALWAWAPQHADIPDPGPSASPEQVVQVYLEAVSARDFETANALVLGQQLQYGRLDPAPRYADVRVEGATTGERISGFADTSQVTATFRQDDADPLTRREYTLVRSQDGQAWRIVDQTAG